MSQNRPASLENHHSQIEILNFLAFPDLKVKRDKMKYHYLFFNFLVYIFDIFIHLAPQNLLLEKKEKSQFDCRATVL